ncbi:hypothetical protein ACXDF8_21980 [Mycolicibacterium sp. CBM1]
MTTISYIAAAALLAEGSEPPRYGLIVGYLAIPVIGVVLLALGLRERSRASRSAAAHPPSYPPPYPAYPPPYPGYPPPPPGAPWYPYPYTGGYSPPPIPPPPPKNTAGRGLIVAGAILLAATAVGTAGRAASGLSRPPADRAAPPVRVGQCIDGEAMAAGIIREGDTADCDDPAAVFEVVTVGGPDAVCPDGKAAGTRFARWTNQAATVCFIPNLAVDHCYAAIDGQPTPDDPHRSDTLKHVDCADSSAEFRVVRRADAVEFGQCPVGSRQILFVEPPRSYCTEPPR